MQIKLRPLRQKDALERYLVLTLRSRLACSVRASLVEVVPTQLVVLETAGMGKLAPCRWVEDAFVPGEVMLSGALNTGHRQLCSRQEWIAVYFVVTGAMIPTTHTRRGSVRLATAQVTQVVRQHPWRIVWLVFVKSQLVIKGLRLTPSLGK